MTGKAGRRAQIGSTHRHDLPRVPRTSIEGIALECRGLRRGAPASAASPSWRCLRCCLAGSHRRPTGAHAGRGPAKSGLDGPFLISGRSLGRRVLWLESSRDPSLGLRGIRDVFSRYNPDSGGGLALWLADMPLSDHKIDTCQVRRFVGRQEENRPGDLLWCREPL
jgi:hypothetical protein